MFPAAIALFGAGALYLAFQGNRQVLEATDERPVRAFATASDLAASLRGSAEHYHDDLGRWPDSIADLNLDGKWMRAHRGIESIALGDDGTVRIGVAAAHDGPAAVFAWTPRQRGDRVLWDCRSDLPDAGAHVRDCEAATREELEIVAPPEDRTPAEAAVTGLDERCQQLGTVGYEVARARAAGEPLDSVIRGPTFTFVEDAQRQDELVALARWIYESPPRTANATQREVLNQYRCRR